MKNKKFQNNMSPLPILFVMTIVINGILNYSSFITLFKEAIFNEGSGTVQAELGKVEEKYSEIFVAKNNYIDLNGAVSRLFDKKLVNEVIKLNNGHLTTLQEEKDFSDRADYISDFSGYLAERDTPYIFVQTPLSIPNDDDAMIPAGYETYANRNVDNLLSDLDSRGVDYLDLRDNLQSEELDTYQLYYATDHHWNTEGAFWAHGHIVEKINSVIKDLDIDSSYYDSNNYIHQTVDTHTLGSHGRRLGIYYTGLDTLTYIHPKEDIYISLEEPVKDYYRTGKFQEVLSNLDYYEERNISFSPESLYLRGNIDYRKLVNENANNQLKIMIINDSFSLPLVPFMTLHFSEVHMYDLREQYGGTKEGFMEKLEEIDPDIVLQIRDTNRVLPETY